MKKSIKKIIFDLDDTLFDTLGTLVLPAAREACQVMVDRGLACTVQQCLDLREQLRKEGFRGNFFDKAVTHFGLASFSGPESVNRVGERAFLQRQIKEKISLFPETMESLKELQKIYRLFLITIGDPQTQAEKVKLLGLRPLFEKIYYVDGIKDKSKKAAFADILEVVGGTASEFLSVGNRIDTDVRFAKELGMLGILYEHGEYLYLKPESRHEKPDAVIKNLAELVAWLRQ